MNVVVINLTRFGDLLQSQATLDDLSKAGHTVDLVCLENFAPAAGLLRQVRRIWPLPGAALLSKTAAAWPEAVCRLQTFAREIRRRAQPGCIFNLTPGAAPRLLTRYLAGDDIKALGLDLDTSGFGLDHGVWASFVSVAARKRANSPFNLADMWRMMALPLSGGMRGSFRLADSDENSKSWAANFLNSCGKPASRYIAFQLGASENRRQWPVENFRQLGQYLWEEARICPVLLGSSEEKHLAERYAAGANHQFINAVSQTNVHQLAALLLRMEILVTNDTGTMHLASGLAIPSLAFFLATAQPWDTGPMLPGCCCLEPALDCHPCPFGTVCQADEQCRQSISPASAGRLITHWLKTGRWNGEGIADARVWETAVDAGGYYQLKALSANAWDGPGAWHAWWRIFWRHMFDDLEKDDGVHVPGFASLPALPQGEGMSLLPQAAKLLRTIAELAPSVAANPQKAGTVFLRNCERLQDLWSEHVGLASLGAFWHEFRSNQGGDLIRFGKQCQIMAAHVDALNSALVQN